MRATLRFLARRKATTTVAVLTLALALGVNTVVFSVLQSFLISGMAIPDVDRLHMIRRFASLRAGETSCSSTPIRTTK